MKGLFKMKKYFELFERMIKLHNLTQIRKIRFLKINEPLGSVELIETKSGIYFKSIKQK